MMKFPSIEDLCSLVDFVAIVGKHCTFLLKLVEKFGYFVREALSGWFFFAVLWFLLKSMINIHKFLLKPCGENWPFVGEALRDWVFCGIMGFADINDKHK